jgi:hypothetical protein
VCILHEVKEKRYVSEYSSMLLLQVTGASFPLSQWALHLRAGARTSTLTDADDSRETTKRQLALVSAAGINLSLKPTTEGRPWPAQRP